MKTHQTLLDGWVRELLQKSISEYQSKWKPGTPEGTDSEPISDPQVLCAECPTLAGCPTLRAYPPMPQPLARLSFSSEVHKHNLMHFVKDGLSSRRFSAVLIITEAWSADAMRREDMDDYPDVKSRPDAYTCIIALLHTRDGTTMYRQKMHEGKPSGKMLVMGNNATDGSRTEGIMVVEPMAKEL